MNRRGFLTGAFLLVGSQAIPPWLWPALKRKENTYRLSTIMPIDYLSASLDLWLKNPRMTPPLPLCVLALV
jgi:hypothetical protein